MLLIKVGSPEWEYMWDMLGKHPINENLPDPTVALNDINGEVWQYIGTFKHDKNVIHEFRHRSFPTDGGVRFYKFNASEAFNDDDIEKTFNIK